MRAPTPKGILVSADGSTEIVEVMGQVHHRVCGCCGHERRFVAIEKMAENRNTMSEASLRKLETLTRSNPGAMVDVLGRSNGGCVVYIEERS